MPFLGARSWLRPLIVLHALVEGLGGFHSLPGLQGGTVLLWFRVLPEHQEVAASSAPHDTTSTEASDSSDDDDDDPPLRTDPGSLSRRSSRLVDSGVTPGPPQDSSGALSGLALDVEMQLQLLRSQRRKLIAAMRNLRFRWSSAEGYIRFRMQRDASRRAKGQPAMLPSRQEVARFKFLYKSGHAKRKQQLRKLERELQDLERQNERLLQMHPVCRKGRGGRPAEQLREDQSGPSTTDKSQSFAEPGPSDLLSAPTDTETTDVAEVDEPVPGCSWWGTDAGNAPLRPKPKAAKPARAGGDERRTAYSKLTLIRAQKANLLAMRRTIRNKWKSQTAYVNMRMHEMNFHRKGKGLPPVELTPELLQELSRQYNDRVVPRLMRELELSGQIGALEEQERDIFKSVLPVDFRTSVTAETETPGSRVPTGGAPDAAMELAAQHALQLHRHVPSTVSTVQSVNMPYLLSAEPPAPPSREQVPVPSWGLVKTTDGALLESRSSLLILGSAGRSHTTTSAHSAHVIGPPCAAPQSCLWQHQEPPVQSGSTESPLAAQYLFPQYSLPDMSATSYAIPCRIGDRGESRYPSPSQLEQHATACSPVRLQSGSELPEDLSDFILDHSTAASAVSAHTAVLEEPVSSPTEPWSPEISFPSIVSPSEQPSTSLWWPYLSSSASGRRLSPSAFLEGRFWSPRP
ncbi:UNVERIFIED_CONTAM: hypothetical protein HHA_245980 [Hammondia hammondi]|eukprot:XP_008883676.1 hypothetical protein HHA_245980 [Hammondia hammondi]